MTVVLGVDVLALLAGCLAAAVALGALVTHLIDEIHHRQDRHH